MAQPAPSDEGAVDAFAGDPATAARPGALVVLEGIDGSGKSTVHKLLVNRLGTEGLDVVETREPTSSPVGNAVRAVLQNADHDPVSEALLFVADHADHVAWVRDQLAGGRIVVSDRYSFSCLAYQAATLADAWPAEADQGPAAWLRAVLAPFELAPDMVLLFDLPVEDALARLEGRGSDNEKFEHAGLLARVRENYLALAKEHGFVTVDAQGSPGNTLQACLEHVHHLVKAKRLDDPGRRDAPS